MQTVLANFLTTFRTVESLRGGGAKFPNLYQGAFGPTVGNSLERKTPFFGTHDKQEEVYIVLAGSGVLTIEGEEFALDGETMARVAPGTKRKVVAGPDGIRMLVLGGVPGKAYEPPEWGELGTPDPMAG
jgi:mannose-6-phosphate isomerase-like protein (cupin superfamily)